MSKQSPFDNKKLTLMTKTLPDGDFPPSLKADMFKDNPSLFVLTGNKRGEGITYVRAGLEHKTAGILCQLVESIADAIIHEYTTGQKAVDSDANTIVSVDCKQGKEKEIVSKVVVGRLKDNKMFISVISLKDSAAPVIQFIFGTDLYHPITISGSDRLNECMSAVAAKEWAIRTRYYWYMYSINNPNEEEPKYQGNKSDNNSGNSNAAAPTGYQASATGDLPWENE